jgi:DNA-binding NarL/FixJ family response regulator
MKEKLIYVANSEKNITLGLEYVFISKEDYVIKTFSSGEELLKNMYKNPDVIVMGQTFSSGLDTLKELKHFKKEIPVIILSKTKEKEIETEFIENGAFQCISQSGYFVDRLLKTVDIALQEPLLSA